MDGASVYGYALQNPGRYVDPRGERCWSYYDKKIGATLIECDRRGPPYCPSGDCAVWNYDPRNVEEWEEKWDCMKNDCAIKPKIVLECVGIGGLVPNSNPVAAATVTTGCIAIAWVLECSNQCDRETGYCLDPKIPFRLQ